MGFFWIGKKEKKTAEKHYIDKQLKDDLDILHAAVKRMESPVYDFEKKLWKHKVEFSEAIDKGTVKDKDSINAAIYLIEKEIKRVKKKVKAAKEKQLKKAD